MSCHPRVIEWTTILRAHLPHLTKPQATVLALWSLGMVLARSCALTAVSINSSVPSVPCSVTASSFSPQNGVYMGCVSCGRNWKRSGGL